MPTTRLRSKTSDSNHKSKFTTRVHESENIYRAINGTLEIMLHPNNNVVSAEIHDRKNRIFIHVQRKSRKPRWTAQRKTAARKARMPVITSTPKPVDASDPLTRPIWIG